MINSASNPCEDLRVYIGFNKELPHKKRKINYCNRCGHPPQVLRFPPLAKPPLKKPPNLRACGAATEPETPESQKYEKITKKNTKSPTLGWAPKIRKKYENGPKLSDFVFFSYFFRNFFVFSGPNPGWAILYLFVFLGFRGFWALSQLRKHATPNQRKAQFYFIFTVLRTLFLLQQNEPFLP